VKIYAWSIPVFLAALVMSATNACAAPTVTYFDVPGGSVDTAVIDNAGEVSGAYLGSDGNKHGYKRTVDGTITTFDGPGGVYTIPNDISKGVIIGQYLTTSPQNGGTDSSGFILPPDGPAVAFSVANSSYTIPIGINNGVIVGMYGGVKKHAADRYAFVRSPTGIIKRFSVPGANETEAGDVNISGVIVGNAYGGPDEGGFIRSPDGSLTTFGVQDGGRPFASSIQIDGIVAGTFIGNRNLVHGFIRSTNGAYKIVDVPGASYTAVSCINNNEWSVGIWSTNADGTNAKSFIRTADGKIKKFSIEQAAFTWLNHINSANVASGIYFDQQNVGHGVIVTP